jgi:ketosteroid isomerase-like protein
MKPLLVVLLLLSLCGCASLPVVGPSVRATRTAETELAALRRQIEDIHGSRDIAAFVALHTDSVVFEWRGRTAPLTGRAALETSQREWWANRRELRLSLQVSDLRIQGGRADENGSYEETWIDPQGNRVTEFGHYSTTYAREADGQWRIAQVLGAKDVTATSKTAD